MERAVTGVGLGPRSPIPESTRQAVLDAAALLQVHRSEIAARAARGAIPGAEIVATGQEGIADHLLRTSPDWKELLSVRPTGVTAQLRVSVPNNRRLVERGLQMISLFDHDALDLEARLLLANETLGSYLFGVAPVQMKIIDRRYVLLQGPEIDGDVSLMAVTSRACLDAAWRYWDSAVSSAVELSTRPVEGQVLSARQHQIIGLLAADLNDEAVAATLSISVRTVRSDVAALLEVLGVRSRFAAGMRLGLSTRVPPTPPSDAPSDQSGGTSADAQDDRSTDGAP